MTDHPESTPGPSSEESSDGEAMTLYHAYDPSLTGEVTASPVSELDRRGLVCRMQSAQAVINRMQGVLYEAMAEFARTAVEPGVVSHEVSLALAITRGRRRVSSRWRRRW